MLRAWCPNGVLDLEKHHVACDGENVEISAHVDLDGIRVSSCCYPCVEIIRVNKQNSVVNKVEALPCSDSQGVSQVTLTLYG